MKKNGHTRIALVVALIAIAAFATGYALNGFNAPPSEVAEHLESEGEHELEKKVDEQGNVIWTCSMHPQIQLPEPGNCPICFMELIPLERKDDSKKNSLREITLTENARKLAGITVEPVKRLDVSVETRMVGKVDYDETRVRTITAWTGGRVVQMHVDYTGDLVKKGQPMVSLYSPELLTAQAELIQAVKARKDLENSKLELVKKSAVRTEEASREKLRLLGLTKQQIEKVIRNGKPADNITLYAPQSGVVIKKNVNEGQYVKTGEPIYSIADLSTLWVILEAYESDLPWIELGQSVRFTTEAYPGKFFEGKVVYVDPVVNEKTRTVRVRLEVSNDDSSLKPGMLVRATQQKDGQPRDKTDSPLVIPASAPLLTGKRAVVYVANPNKEGAFEGREVILGAKAGNYYIVKNGLEENEKVVTNGNFKIDSAVQIVAKPSMMNPSAGRGSMNAEELPPLFASKLRLLKESFITLSSVVETSNLNDTHLAFGKFNKELRMIDGSDLEGSTALNWKEYSMLLSNDAILGAEAQDKKRLHEIFGEMKQHFDALQAQFNIADKSAKTSTPIEFKEQLGKVFAQYEALSEALANDNADKARQAAATLGGALQAVDASVLAGPAHNAWAKSLTQMNDGLEAIRNADDIVGIRTGFEPISVGLSSAVVDLGVEMEGSLYEIYCPMAFEYEGATWLQRDESIRNPYFGSAMSSCGEVNQQLK